MGEIFKLAAAVLLIAVVLGAFALEAGVPEAWRVWHRVQQVERELAQSLRDVRLAGLVETVSGWLSQSVSWVRSVFGRAGPSQVPATEWLGEPIPGELARLHRPEGIWLEDGVLGLVAVPLARLHSPALLGDLGYPDFPIPRAVLEVRVVRDRPVSGTYEAGTGWRRWVVRGAED
ncbi:MAG TPA: hypothetical protein DEQ28_01910 [Clostridiales bacterium]|nr:hypothetical protein [Clostridiales bacterium]